MLPHMRALGIRKALLMSSGPVCPGGRLLARYPNLRADLSAHSGGCAILRGPAFGLDFLHRFAGQLLFGTDMSRAD